MKKTVLTFILILLTLVGCSESNQSSQEKEKTDSLTIYATLYPLAYFAEEIGGQYAEVETILPPGADPHNYEPTSKMMVDIAGSDMFLFNGANLESYAGKIESALSEEDVLVVEASHNVSLEEHIHPGEEESHNEEDEQHTGDAHSHSSPDHDHGHSHGDQDPHIWLDPIRSIELSRNIKDSFIELMPEQSEMFEENFHQLEDRLIALDEDFHEKLKDRSTNDILVTHAAYGYWEQSYGIEQISIAGLSPSQEPSQKQIEEILEYVKENNTQYLLFEQNVEPKVAKVVQEETGIESLELHNVSVLTEDDLSNDETYFTLMERNLEVLLKALNN